MFKHSTTLEMSRSNEELWNSLVARLYMHYNSGVFSVRDNKLNLTFQGEGLPLDPNGPDLMQKRHRPDIPLDIPLEVIAYQPGNQPRKVWRVVAIHNTLSGIYLADGTTSFHLLYH